jgi:ribA/ribD-fused uncharacterized protein
VIKSFSGEYRFLSNFYRAEIAFAGTAWPSTEHAYQAMKTTDPELRAAIRNAPTCGAAKKMGADVPRRGDWNTIKNSVMLQVVRAKFFQHPHLAKQLLATGYEELIEGNTWGDQYWGVCGGVGQNHLGQILMRVRAELRESAILEDAK